ncbi:RagB/SusD family nutrient uptake outer membrane protein [Lutibacter citreus]|uniref:RagB/SusD family nutrient uptake outer membrane protein n=1 Tax=Lutibacter citreus TaxID=2138210 RepID=UPI000DBE6A81|nr:RagB/SusD family nutrient uptake outer membrane protein [Lutibacter citreus]
MKYIYNLILLGVLLVFSSCDKEEWLDIKPKGLIIPTNVQDYRLLLDQVNRNGNGFPKISPGFGECYANTDYMSDDFVIADNTLSSFNQTSINQFTWSNDVFQENEEDNDWAQLYGQIYAANIVIEEIMDAENGTNETKLQLLAEAKIQRAFSYFSLVNIYGLHYGPSSAATNLAVPLRLDSQIEGADLSRASVQEIYDLMLDDIGTSIENLPNKPESNDYKHRPTKASAYAFLARLNLYMGNYEDALEAASSSLSIHSAINNYNDYSFFYNVLYLDQPQDDAQVLWLKGSTGTYNLLIASDELYNLYEANDIRQTLYAPISFFFGIPEPGNCLGYSFFNNYRPVGFTVPEILLIRAECNARLNFVADAVNDLNTLRINRFKEGTYTPIISTDKTEVLNLVKKERRIELAGNGLRFFDLKRYNEFDNANISLTRNLKGQTYTLNAGSNNWAVPIAKKYIFASPDIGENIRD